jgi:hypothetical protein
MDYEKMLARIYEHLEEDRVENAVMGCLRIARAAKDYLPAATFLRELNPDKTEVVRALYDELAHLNKDTKVFLLKTSLERWLEVHTLDFEFPSDDDDEFKEEGDKRKVLRIGAGEFDSRRDQFEGAISDLTLPSGMSPYDTAAFTDRNTREKATLRLQITAIQTVKSRLKAHCLNYAIQMERQLELQHNSQSFLDSAQNEVNNFFKARADDVYLKLQKATQLAASKDLEDCALLLTQVRRALKAAADHFYPAVDGSVLCADGKQRVMGDEQYLNRLQEFLSRRLARSTSRELLQAELDHLAAFFRRLNDIASKGVHSSVTLAEARQGLVGLYFFLFNVCQHLSFAELESAS